MSDPKWYHSPEEVYYDNRNVLIGLRAEPFVPNERLTGYSGKEFLKLYECQLKMLDFNEIMQRFKNLEKQIGKSCDFALIFHEAPDNPCSERGSVQKWFAENGLEIAEWKGEEL